MAGTTQRHGKPGLAAVRGTAEPPQIPLPLEPRVGALALALGADADAAPTARLTVIHHVSANGTDPALTLDMPADLVAEGGPVLDAAGGLLGMAIIGAGGEATVVLYAAIARMLDPTHAHIRGRRGWLGVALQPITVPETMRGAVGQSSGRIVLSLAPNGRPNSPDCGPATSCCRWTATASAEHTRSAPSSAPNRLGGRSMSGCCATARWKRASLLSRHNLPAERTPSADSPPVVPRVANRLPNAAVAKVASRSGPP